MEKTARLRLFSVEIQVQCVSNHAIIAYHTAPSEPSSVVPDREHASPPMAVHKYDLYDFSVAVSQSNTFQDGAYFARCCHIWHMNRQATMVDPCTSFIIHKSILHVLC